MDTRLMQLLVCPLCKGPLLRSDDALHLVCKADHLAYPIRDGIPVMLESEAVPLESLEVPVPPPFPVPGTDPTHPGHTA